MAPRMGADERLVADLPGSSKMYFIEELSEILHVFRDTPRKTLFDEESQYKTDFPDWLRNKPIMGNSELSLNFGISHGEFYYCKLNNFLQEKKRESVIL